MILRNPSARPAPPSALPNLEEGRPASSFASGDIRGTTGGVDADAGMPFPVISTGSLVRGRVALKDRLLFPSSRSVVNRSDAVDPVRAISGAVELRNLSPVSSFLTIGRPLVAGDVAELLIAIGESSSRPKVVTTVKGTAGPWF